MTSDKHFKKIQDHLKAVGFIFNGSSIYGGLANTYDYGPLGILLKNNLRALWWREFITKETSNYGLDSKVLMNPLVWKASGHLENFADLLIENKVNGKRYRVDHVLQQEAPNIDFSQKPLDDIKDYFVNNITSYEGSAVEWNDIRQFNLLFETKQGVVDMQKTKIFLRPETAQGIFVNFKNVQRTMRAKVPFGIGQSGISFRNEITPRNFLFRTREFEQMELEYFVKESKAQEFYDYYLKKSHDFLIKHVGLNETSLRLQEHSPQELAHYALATVDIEFHFPFGWGELMGVANRGQFDLRAHQELSGENMQLRDEVSNELFFPFVIEPSLGLDRLFLALISDAFTVQEVADEQRIVLKLPANLAPYKVAVLPLIKKLHNSKAQEIFQKLANDNISLTYDASGSIGKRYRRQDAIGTPLAITVDDKTLSDDVITLRNRDTMKQIEVALDELAKHL